MNLILFPAIYRQVIHQFKGETGLSRTDFEILTTLHALSDKKLICTPKDLAKRLPTLSRDYLYDSISKLKNLGYIEQIRKPLKYSLEKFSPARSGLYACTEKGKELVKKFVKEMEQLNEVAIHGYY